MARPIDGEWLFELTLAQDEDANELREWVQGQPEDVRDMVEVVTDVLADLVFTGAVDADMDHRPTGSDWTDSPDFRQVVNYARDLDVPAILDDAPSVYVLSSDLQGIEREFERQWAATCDLAAIAELALGTNQPSSSPREPRSPT